MEKNKKLIGAALAAAALALTTVPVTSAMAAGTDAGVQCFGANACKGQSACKGANNACKGQNSCKGKGFVIESGADACTDAGGHV